MKLTSRCRLRSKLQRNAPPFGWEHIPGNASGPVVRRAATAHRALLLVPFPDRNDEVKAGMLWQVGNINPSIRSVTAECGQPGIAGHPRENAGHRLRCGTQAVARSRLAARQIRSQSAACGFERIPVGQLGQ